MRAGWASSSVDYHYTGAVYSSRAYIPMSTRVVSFSAPPQRLRKCAYCATMQDDDGRNCDSCGAPAYVREVKPL